MRGQSTRYDPRNHSMHHSDHLRSLFAHTGYVFVEKGWLCTLFVKQLLWLCGVSVLCVGFHCGEVTHESTD